MLRYEKRWMDALEKHIIFTELTGKALLNTPLLNKGTAFTEEERTLFRLRGKLPYRVESLEEQLARAYQQYQSYQDPLQKYIYLNNLHDKNEVLFYKLLREHLAEMLPMIYTPTVGAAVRWYSQQYRQPRGLFIAYPDREAIEEMLDNRTHADISIITVTDAEGILGIGDQGVGGINIPLAKQVVYSVCGVDPYQALPILLDVGTNNPEHLQDPLYLGWRHPRISGQEYADFIHQFVGVVQKKFPHIFLHWEDFGSRNAHWILQKYRSDLCIFNDDIQGTGAVVLAALLAASTVAGLTWADQRIIIFGAGTAGVGIADQILTAMHDAGLSLAQGRARIYLVDKQGLVTTSLSDIPDFQAPYAKPEPGTDLLGLVERLHPTVLIGTSTVSGAFHEKIIRAMAQHTARPVIFPLSNPTQKAEAVPADLLEWSQGRALIATGSPFGSVHYAGHAWEIAQCNNALVFPGLGLGVLSCGAASVSDGMLRAAAQAIYQASPLVQGACDGASLLPSLAHLDSVAIAVAQSVIKVAIAEGIAREQNQDDCFRRLQGLLWEPSYCPMQYMGS